MCKYDAEHDISITSTRRRNEVLLIESDLLYRLIVYMSTYPKIEAQDVSCRIRACHEPVEVAKSFSGC